LDARERFRQIDRLNQDELSQACLNKLPVDWRSKDELHCLTMLLWALTELDLPAGKSSLDQDDLLAVWHCLDRWPTDHVYL
jgi:hypothetical protein